MLILKLNYSERRFSLEFRFGHFLEISGLLCLGCASSMNGIFGMQDSSACCLAKMRCTFAAFSSTLTGHVPFWYPPKGGVGPLLIGGIFSLTSRRLNCRLLPFGAALGGRLCDTKLKILTRSMRQILFQLNRHERFHVFYKKTGSSMPFLRFPKPMHRDGQALRHTNPILQGERYRCQERGFVPDPNCKE